LARTPDRPGGRPPGHGDGRRGGAALHLAGVRKAADSAGGGRLDSFAGAEVLCEASIR